MSIVPLLASSLGRKDEEPNKALAKALAASNDVRAVAELVGLFQQKDKNLPSDSIKVLYELAELAPELVAPHASIFVDLLRHQNNRLVWGAMTALDMIAGLQPKIVYASLSEILKVADAGSVITKDHAVGMLIKLMGLSEFRAEAFRHLLEQLQKAATNQLPMYAEQTATVLPSEYKAELAALLIRRLPEVEKESKQKRIEKVIRRLQK